MTSATGRRLSLRARLVVGMLLLVATGLVGSAALTYTALDRFLQQRLDEQLSASRAPVLDELARGEVFQGLPSASGAGRGSAPSGRTVIPNGTFGELRRWWGGVVRYSDPDLPHPELPSEARPGRHLSSVGSEQDGYDYRLLSTVLNGQGDVLLVAFPLEEVRQTRARLLAVEAAVVATVLALTGLIGLWVIRVGLRPLDEIATTAGAIAGGDLSRRVERAEPGTEVGRLGLALNAMLTQIEQAFDARRRSEERLRRFVADASHELRTPLTSIRGYAELFGRGAGDRPEDLATVMRRIEEESAAMSVLVDDLLLLARLDQRRPLERHPVALDRLVGDAVEDFRAAAPGRVVVADLAGPVPVLGDEPRLRQVLGNLLANARVHTPDGTTVRVSLRAAGPGPDGVIRLVVADDGPGVPPELAPSVFERFTRADDARTRNTGGSGLGLAIVAAIVEAHGGTVTLERAEPHGARFVVELASGG